MSAWQRLTLLAAGAALGLLLLALAAPSLVAVRSVERELLPELEAKAAVLGGTLGRLCARATERGIPLAALVGVDEVFAKAQALHPEFDLLLLADGAGRVLFQRGAPADFKPLAAASAGLRDISEHRVLVLALADADGSPAWLHIGSHRRWVQRLLIENLLDIGVVLVVSLFISIELLRALGGGGVTRSWADLGQALARGRRGNFAQPCRPATLQALGALPRALNGLFASVNARHASATSALRRALAGRSAADRGALRRALAAWRDLRQRHRFGSGSAADAAGARDAALGRLRMPLFLFLIAEDLSRSFLPVHAGTLESPWPGLSPHWATGLPVMLFMLIVAVLQPAAGRWSEHFGRRHLLVFGMAGAALAHGAAAAAQGLPALLGLRALAGVAWALVFAAGQAHVLARSDAASRGQALAAFVGVIMSAALCGPPIGGLLADGIGARATLVLGALLAALAAALAWRALAPDARASGVPTPPLRWQHLLVLMQQRRFVLLCLAAAVPAKALLIGICFYLVPLAVVDDGGTVATAGRLIMLYGLAVVLAAPWAARWSDRLQQRSRFVAGGLLLSGLAGLLPLAWPGLAGLAVAMGLLGLAQALSIAPQAAMLGEVCRAEMAALGQGTVYGVYRLVERLGNVLGPALAALCVAQFGYAVAFAALGSLALVAAGVFALGFGLGRARRRAGAAA